MARCDLVELYPGYPGYQGFLTGVVGEGEGNCESDLERLDRDFSVSSEDRENRRAARELGIKGQPEDWTWEQWMRIESERRLVPTCYSCLYVNCKDAPPYTVAEISNSDPRLLLGRYGEKSVAYDFVTSNDLPTYQVDNLPTDDELRALAHLIYDDSELNAAELLQAELDVLAYFVCLKKMNGSCVFFDISALYRTMINQGGYAPTPPDAQPWDQYYMIAESCFTLGKMGLSPDYLNSLMYLLEESWQEWRRDPGEASFAKYLREICARDWM